MNPFYASSLLYLTVGLLTAGLQAAVFMGLLEPVAALNWLRVHFITIGTVTMFAFGAAPQLLAKRSGGQLPSAAMTWGQWGILNAGFVAVLVGMAGSSAWLASAGAWTVFAAVGLLFVSLRRAAGPASGGHGDTRRFFVTAPLFLLAGIVMAVSLLLGWPAPGGRMGILEAHVHANAWGFLAFLVTGTLAELLPKLARRPLAHPGWLRYIYWALLAGVSGLIAGPWLNLHALTLAGLVVYVGGTVLLLMNLMRTAAGAIPSLSPAVAHLLLGYVWMIVPVFFAPFILLAPELVPAAQVEAAAVQGLIFGWALQMAMGGMPAVLRGFPSGDAESGGGSWFSVVLVNAGVAVSWVARLLPPEAAGLPGVGLGMGLVMAGALPFAVQVWTVHIRREAAAA